MTKLTAQERRLAEARALGFALIPGNDRYVKCPRCPASVIVSRDHPAQVAAHKSWHDRGYGLSKEG